MAKALEEQLRLPEAQALSFEERLGLLVDREVTVRDNRQLTNRLRRARLRQPAALEDIDYTTPRGLDKALLTRLASGQWLAEHLNILLTGPTGLGKSWLACALAQQACRQGYTARYWRLPRLLQDLALTKGDGRYAKVLAELAKTELRVIDDWGLNKPSPEHCRALVELLDDRHGLRSTLVTSQLPLEHWHDYLGVPTLADAMLDRLVHHAYKLTFTGESMRRRQARLTDAAPAA